MLEHNRSDERWKAVLPNVLEMKQGPEPGSLSPRRYVPLAFLLALIACTVFSVAQVQSAPILIREQTVQPDYVIDLASNAVAVSPDSAYVFSMAGSRIVSFARDAQTGWLSFINEVGGASGAYTQALAVSPDGANLYYVGGHLVVFTVNPTTGALAFLEEHRNGEGGVDGVKGTEGVAVSPDGRHVYVGSSNAVALFERDLGSGALSFVESVFDDVGGVVGLSNVISVTVSPDGAHVYATSDSPDDAVVVFARDAATGTLTFIAANFSLQNPISIAISPDGAHAYVTSFFPTSDSVNVLARDSATGLLTLIERHGGLGGAERVVVSPDGAQVYVQARISDGVFVYSRDAVTGRLTLLEADVEGLDGVDSLEFCRAIAVSPDGGSLYVAARDEGLNGENAVTVFDRDPATGALSLVHELRAVFVGVEGILSPTSVAVDPDDAHVYVTGEFDDAVVLFDRDGTTGRLSFVEAIYDGVGLDGIERASSIAFSPDGAQAYVTGALDSALAVFARDGVTGRLTFAESHFDGVDGIDGLWGASDVVVSPDGANVYVAGYLDDAVAAFSRDPADGSLSFLEAHFDDSGGVSGLDGVRAVSVSPDGRHIYVASGWDNALAVFSRDPGTGSLAFTQAVINGVGGVDGIRRAHDVIVSPDGANVYATGFSDGAVAGFSGGAVTVFARDEISGALTLREVHRDGVGIVDGLEGGALAVAMSPDGKTVYSGNDEKVVEFGRDPADGSLQFRLAIPQVGSTAIAVSGDGGFVYTAGGSGFHLSHLYEIPGPTFVLRHASICPPTPMLGCRSAGRSSLFIFDHVDDRRDRLVYRWRKGEETVFGDFGDPVQGLTQYALCLYDETGGSPGLRFDPHARNQGICKPKTQPRSCWRQLGSSNPRGYEYLDKLRSPDGLPSISLQAGAEGRSKVLVRGRGERLRSLPDIPMTPPVTAQVINSDGECWATTFSSADVFRNKVVGAMGNRAVFGARRAD